MHQPLLTVVVTSYNYAHFLPECMDSILGQDFTDFELIILDNFSSDNTEEVVLRYKDDPRVQYIRHEINVGAIVNFNYACRVGSGKYYALISADDFILPNHFSRLMTLLQEHQQCALAYTKICQVDQHGALIGEAGHSGNASESYVGARDEVIQLLVHGVYSCLPSIVFNRELIGDELFFDIDTWGASDWDLIVRIARKYPDFIFDNTVTTCYRRHAGQYTSTDFYVTPEPLYGHMFMLEQALIKMNAGDIARYGGQFAGLLRRWSMSFGLQQLSQIEQSRLAHILTQLESGKRFSEKTINSSRIAVVLPLPHVASHLGEIFSSINRQTWKDWECIVVHSGDRTQYDLLMAEVHKIDVSARLAFLQHDGDDLAEMLNAGMGMTSGEYIIAFDHPVILSENAFEKIVQQFDEYAHLDIVSMNDGQKYLQPQTLSFRSLSEKNPVALIGACRRHMYKLVGGHNPAVGNPVVMWDFWMRAMKRDATIMSLTTADLSSAATTRPGASTLDLSRLIFGNPECVSAEALKKTAIYLLENTSVWMAQNKLVLERNPVCSTAYLLRALGQSLVPKVVAAPGRPAPLGSHEYTQWILNTRPSPKYMAHFHQIGVKRLPVRIAVLVLDFDAGVEQIDRTLRSLQEQIESPARIVVLSTGQYSDASNSSITRIGISGDWQRELNHLLTAINDDWIYLVHAGDVLESIALAAVSDAVTTQPDLAFIYGDEDVMMPDGTVQDYAFKPAMNLDLLRSTPYIGRNFAACRDVILESGGFASHVKEAAGVDLLLRILEVKNFGAIGHIDRILSHNVISLAQWRNQRDVSEGMADAVQDHLHRMGVAAKVLPIGDGCQRVLYQHAELPLVSIVIQSNGSWKSLKNCLSSLLEKTAFGNYEVIVVEPSPMHLEEKQIRHWLAELAASDQRIRAMPDESAGHFAANANLAVATANGDYVVMLADSARILHQQWLDVLLGYAQRQEVGIVGTKIIDGQGLVVSAGCVLGLGGAVGNVFVGEPFQSDGYLSRLKTDQNYSEVSGVCMMINRRIFQAVGGFDQQYRVTDHDADFCLKVKSSGYLCVWTPHTAILHEPEPLVYAATTTQGIVDRAVFYKKWWAWIGNDPAYNRNLTLSGFSFAIESRPALAAPLPGLEKQPRVVSINMGRATGNAPVEAIDALAGQGDVLALHTDSLLPVWELAKLSTQVLVLRGRPHNAALAWLKELRANSPLHVVYYAETMPDESDPAMIMVMLGLVDRILLSGESLKGRYAELHRDVRVISECLPLQPWFDLYRTDAPPQKLRVGIQGDLEPGQWRSLTAELASVAKDIELIVYAKCYPLALHNVCHEYHQLTAFKSNPALMLFDLKLDLALVPLSVTQGASQRRQVLEYGACGIAVVVEHGVSGMAGLPVSETGKEPGSWADNIRRYLSEPAQARTDGNKLRDVVVKQGGLRGTNLKDWMMALTFADKENPGTCNDNP